MNAFTQDQITKRAEQRKGQFRTLLEGAAFLQLEPKDLRYAAARGLLTPDAVLSSKRQGRPAFLYSTMTLRNLKRDLV